MPDGVASESARRSYLAFGPSSWCKYGERYPITVRRGHTLPVLMRSGKQCTKEAVAPRGSAF